MFNLIPNKSISQEAEVFLFRDKQTHLYLAYDGFDTTFSKGVSPSVAEFEVLEAINKSLISVTKGEIIDMLNDPTDKRWVPLGGIDRVEIVRCDLMLDAEALEPTDLMHVLIIEKLEKELDELDSEGIISGAVGC